MQLIVSEDNIADVQAEYEGPGELTSPKPLLGLLPLAATPNRTAYLAPTS